MSGIWFRFNVIWHLPTIIKSLWCCPCAAGRSVWLALGDGKWGWLGTVHGGSGRQPSSPLSPRLHQALVLPVPVPVSVASLPFWLILKQPFLFQPQLTCPFPLLLLLRSHPLFAKNKNLPQLYQDRKMNKKLQGSFLKTHYGSIVPEGIWESVGPPLPPP